MLGLLFLLVCLLWSPLVWAQCPGVTSQLSPYAKEQLTIGATVQPLTPNVYKPPGTTPSMAMISIEGGSVRYQVVGLPSATDGHPIQGSPPQTFVICGLDAIAAFRAIRQSTDATLNATYYKPKAP